MSYKIIIADDHPIFRRGIKEIVKNIPFVEWKGEATNGMEAYQLILATQPDIAILDLEMPLLNGLDVCKKILSEKQATKFIILTMHKEKHFFDDAMQLLESFFQLLRIAAATVDELALVTVQFDIQNLMIRGSQGRHRHHLQNEHFRFRAFLR